MHHKYFKRHQLHIVIFNRRVPTQANRNVVMESKTETQVREATNRCQQRKVVRSKSVISRTGKRFDVDFLQGNKYYLVRNAQSL